jgi:aspartyl-tRNA(Asn)/glutamyl-tRNA(Gln) amidotransferase subunit C
MAELSADDVRHVALLARLDVTDEQVEHYRSHLQKVLDHAADIEALDLADVPPTAHPIPLGNPLRDDVVGPTLDRAEVLAEAPDADDETHFRVPPILGEEP